MTRKDKNKLVATGKIPPGHVYTEVYYTTGDLPLKNGKKFLIKLISKRVGLLPDRTKVELMREGHESKWRIPVTLHDYTYKDLPKDM